jgi:hypothetical protein
VVRSVKRHAARLDLDFSHFTYQRAWSDNQLRAAVGQASTWAEVLASLGITDRGESRARVKGHAVRLGLSTSHLQPPPVDASSAVTLGAMTADPTKLRTAAESIAVAWFAMRGFPVAIPSDPAAYDLLVTLPEGIRRVQVKSGTRRGSSGGYVVSVGRRPYSLEKIAGHAPYDPDDIDDFFIVDGSGALYFMPITALAGKIAIDIRAYRRYRIGDASSLFATAA